MVMGFKNFKMARNIKDNGKMINLMVLEFYITLMAMYTKEIFPMGLDVKTELKNG